MNLATRPTEHAMSGSELFFLHMSLAKKEADQQTHESRTHVPGSSLPNSYSIRQRGTSAVPDFSWLSTFTGPPFGPLLVSSRSPVRWSDLQVLELAYNLPSGPCIQQFAMASPLK